MTKKIILVLLLLLFCFGPATVAVKSATKSKVELAIERAKMRISTKKQQAKKDRKVEHNRQAKLEIASTENFTEAGNIVAESTEQTKTENNVEVKSESEKTVVVTLGDHPAASSQKPAQTSQKQVPPLGKMPLAIAAAPVVVTEVGSSQSAKAEEKQPELTEMEQFEQAIMGGKVDFNIRLRAEFVEQDGFETSSAYTSRIRLGYGSKPYRGFSFYIDMEDIRSADDDRYNAAGLNANPKKAVIADPEDTELNQAYIKYAYHALEVITGRQRIILDDARFVGNVGWRQNEQTFDAATVKYQGLKDWKFFYSYLWDINRIFGPDSDRDFESDTHLVNVSYNGLPCGKITAFAYLLDFANSPMNSSKTYGIRLAGKNQLCPGYTLGHVLSYAAQSDTGENPSDYNADYYLVQGSVTKKGTGTIGTGYEVLSSDNDLASFQTPLATLHGKNGWADVFLVTPASGLEDVYVFAATTLPMAIKAKVVFHWFFAEDSGGDYGEELDIVLSKKVTKNMTVLAKFADFDGNDGFSDRTKFWLQTELKF